ncbi:hypothetical protein ACS8E6_15100 [Salinicola halophyticus]|uniref:hypothetical protein n=1 Tax=Salinicola halophyticus TaxID=1808881 RepID=UPI003F44E72F
MPRSETVLQVFVASPGDVADEREVLESVVVELNRTWSKSLGVRLELLRWETSTRPGIGSEPQDVINSQIGDEYDVFIGILWGRIGSPTSKADSGTLEEFERARSRWEADTSSVEIMVYFKDKAIKPSEIDGVQNNRVQQFKRSLGEEGVLHRTFEGIENFESLIRTHLSAVAQKWSKGQSSSPPSLASPPVALPGIDVAASADAGSDDDFGFLDHLDRFEMSMEQMSAGLHAITDATVSMGEQMNRRTAEIQEIGEINDPQRIKDARRAVKASAEDMSRYANILDGQLPLLTSSRKEAFEAISKALSLYEDFDSEDSSQIDELKHSLHSMVDAAGGSLISMQSFRTTIGGLPRLTSDLNRAKRRVMKSLDDVAAEVKATTNTADSIVDSLP